MRTLIAKLALKYTQCVPNHRGRFRTLLLLDRIFGPFKLRTPTGPVLEVFLSSIMDLSYFRNFENSVGDHKIDEVTPQLIANLKHGECFVDVGANIGYLSFLASRFVGKRGRVVAIEPSPREYTRLLRGIIINGATNVVPINGAFGEAATAMVLEISPYHTGLNHLILFDSKRIEADKSLIPVPVWKADSILPPLVEGHEVGLVKIDTEGAEVLVLRGMRNFLAVFKPKYVIVEVTPRFLAKFRTDENEIYHIMKGLGYEPKICSKEWQYDEVFERL